MAGGGGPPPARRPLIAWRLGRPVRRLARAGRRPGVAVRVEAEPAVAVAAAAAPASFMAGARVNLIASATARAVSILATYPIDTLKTRLQASAVPLRLSAAAAAGPLYAGAASALVTNIPYGALTFGLYETLRGTLNDAAAADPTSPAARLPPAWRTAAAAVVGDVTGSLWLTPGELIKQKVQAGGAGGAVGVARRMWAAGGAGAFYQGYASQVARDVPFRVIQLVTYEELRRAYVGAKARRARPAGAAVAPPSAAAAAAGGAPKVAVSGVEGMLLGAAAGSFTAAVTTPLDVVKTRMMTAEVGALVGGVPGVVRQVVREEGLRGLARGMGPRVVYIGPSCAIFFAVFEGVKGRLRGGGRPRRPSGAGRGGGGGGLGVGGLGGG
ncbi:hypothetical protein BU14_0027s0014 [Porphyra umbilicalis]|uniref:Uncharacterized protein n=1 Tax=Porphyra umbilicalis TaxID=2786 RepID=A0A1X6PJV1_PORUM|nr:hypothetical protein BU14_0027s0014 [Porphyra umbilicalis]|eukprot:OSX80988.1 hypothetical protein BU14_0027s0014 [Porphyra umbilicalis]